MIIDVFNKKTNKYMGEIERKSTHERQFGNFGAFEISIGGKRYWGTGKDIFLESDVIDYLQWKMEFLL
jgi:hypothetical protein